MEELFLRHQDNEAWRRDEKRQSCSYVKMKKEGEWASSTTPGGGASHR